jgi:hypothetical protein
MLHPLIAVRANLIKNRDGGSKPFFDWGEQGCRIITDKLSKFSPKDQGIPDLLSWKNPGS